MKNIGYISSEFSPMSSAVSVRSSFFVDKLILKKHNVTIFTSVKNNRYNIIQNKLKLPTNKDGNHVRLLRELFYGIELFFRIIFSKKMDMYIISSPPFFITIFAFLAVKIKNSKNIILDVRDIYPEVFFESNVIDRMSFMAKILKKIELYMYENSKSILTVTSGLKDLVLSRGIQNHKVHVVRNGYDLNLFKINNNKYENFTIVFHGTLGRFQNIEMLIDLIRRFNILENKIQFLVIGTGSKDSLINNIKLPNLRYLENVKYHEIPKIISKCHLGLSLRTDDKISQSAFPVKVFEYIGVGIPILITPKSEAGEVIEKEKLGIQSTNELSEIVDNIYNIKNKYDHFISELHNKRNMFSRQYESEKFYEIIINQ